MNLPQVCLIKSFGRHLNSCVNSALSKFVLTRFVVAALCWRLAMAQVLKSFPRVARLLRDATNRILHQVDTEIPKQAVGSDYGSHTIASDFIQENSIVYSFGIGTDVSFDIGLIDLYGCKVHAFDPTPRSFEWLAKQSFDSRLILHPIGLGQSDGATPFREPDKASYVSYSPGTTSDRHTLLQVRRLRTIMRDLNHDNIDVLKMDIEGFEYASLEDVLNSNIFPKIIAVEFHHRMYGFTEQQTRDSCKALKSAGYGLFHVSDTGREYSFIRMPS